MGKRANSLTVPDDFQVEDDHRTLTRAVEITHDSRRMGKVRRFHSRQTRNLQTVGRMLSGKRKR